MERKGIESFYRLCPKISYTPPILYTYLNYSLYLYITVQYLATVQKFYSTLYRESETIGMEIKEYLQKNPQMRISEDQKRMLEAPFTNLE